MHKLLIVYYEPQTSGQTTHVQSLCNGLDRKKFSITVVLPSKLNKSIAAINKTGVDIVPLPINKVLWNYRAISKLWTLIQTQKFDIVHVVGQEAGLLSRVIAYFAGANSIVYTPQCTNIRREEVFWLYRAIEKILSHITNVIISVNENDRMRIIQWGIIRSKVVTIPNGIDLKLFSKQSNPANVKQTLGLVDGCPLVMQVGRLTYQKNPLAFVEGASLVVQEHQEVQFALIGEGPLKNEVETYIGELGINEYVKCFGWKDNACSLIPAADIISLTSRWEGSPYTLLEAMAWSRPVITTEVNGCPEMVKNEITGYLVPEGDVTTWSTFVIKMLNNPGKSIEMGLCGRQLVEEVFSLQKMINDIQKLYELLIFQDTKRKEQNA